MADEAVRKRIDAKLDDLRRAASTSFLRDVTAIYGEASDLLVAQKEINLRGEIATEEGPDPNDVLRGSQWTEAEMAVIARHAECTLCRGSGSVNTFHHGIIGGETCTECMGVGKRIGGKPHRLTVQMVREAVRRTKEANQRLSGMPPRSKTVACEVVREENRTAIQPHVNANSVKRALVEAGFPDAEVLVKDQDPWHGFAIAVQIKNRDGLPVRHGVELCHTMREGEIEKLFCEWANKEREEWKNAPQ